MTDLRKAAEGALAVMTAKPSSITSADWADAIDALRAALARQTLDVAHQLLQDEAVTDGQLTAMVLAAFKVPPTQGWHYPLAPNQLRRFADLVAAAEREAILTASPRHPTP